MRRRFFVEQFENGAAVMEGEAAHHLARVLRAETGQLYELSDGAKVWLSRVDKVARDRVDFLLLEPVVAAESSFESALLLSIVKFDAFEWALEKATELGVSKVVPLAAARSEAGLVRAAEKRAVRWKKILLESSQQSRRVRMPVLGNLVKPEAAFEQVKADLKLMLSEKPAAQPLRDVLQGVRATSAALVIGPEGGWTDAEFLAAEKVGFQSASLGNLILRTETAVVIALGNLNYALG